MDDLNEGLVIWERLHDQIGGMICDVDGECSPQYPYYDEVLPPFDGPVRRGFGMDLVIFAALRSFSFVPRPPVVLKRSQLELLGRRDCFDLIKHMPDAGTWLASEGDEYDRGTVFIDGTLLAAFVEIIGKGRDGTA